MINLYDGKLTDLLTAADFQNDPEVQAIAYAVLQEKRRIINHAKQTRTLAVIDELPEDILDILAVELRTPFYSDSFSITSKRELIKGTLIFYAYMGTPKAVNAMLSAVFPGSYIEEWQDYGGTPFHFQVVMESVARGDVVSISEIIRSVGKVQRLSAHLDGVIYQCEVGIVIGTKGRGYTYHSPWCGRHEAGTVPWRDHRAGIGTGVLEAVTAGTAHHYNSPLNGTEPWRDTRGGAATGNIEAATAGHGWPYFSTAREVEAGTVPFRNTESGTESGAIYAEAEGTAFHYHTRWCKENSYCRN